MDKQKFLWLCRGFGYRPLPFNGGYLLACVKPRQAELYDGCTRREYQPEQVSNPHRRRVEITWRPPLVLPDEAEAGEEPVEREEDAAA
jgi:hypothetical protein